MARVRKKKAGARPAAAPARLPRVAKGRKPQYFADPAVDKLLSITLTLAGELAVTRDRLDAVERLLEQRRILTPQDVDAFEPGAAAAKQRDARRAAYLDRILRVVQTELEEMTGPDMPKSNDDVIAAVSE
jgi:hypothetical protein